MALTELERKLTPLRLRHRRSYLRLRVEVECEVSTGGWRLLRSLFHLSLRCLLLAFSLLFFLTAAGLPRKIVLASLSRHQIATHRHSLHHQSLAQQPHFRSLLNHLRRDAVKEPALLILNHFALNLTLNWLCNVRHIPDVLPRLVLVTLDQESHQRLTQLWPQLRLLHWPQVSLRASRFSFGQPLYQLFLFLRVQLATALLKEGLAFWMLQPDTLWRDSLFKRELPEADLLLDDSAPWGLDSGKVAGGVFRVRPTPATLQLFEHFAWRLSWAYVPDNSLLTGLCHEIPDANCHFLPFSLVANWLWFHRPTRPTPLLLQFDGEYDNVGSEGKLATMQRLGLAFHSPGGTCRPDVPQRLAALTAAHLTRKARGWRERKYYAAICLGDVLFRLLGHPFRGFVFSAIYFLMPTV